MLTSVMGESAPADPLLPILEYGSSDVNQYAALALTKTSVAGLRLMTADKPESSQRYREVLNPMRVEDELTASFVVDSMFWGCARLYRTGRWPPFDATEVAFMASLAGALAEGFRMALLVPGLSAGEVVQGPGILVLDDRGQLESISPDAERWLREITDVVPCEDGALPLPIHGVAARALMIADDSEGSTTLARCRVRTRSGGWLILHGSPLKGKNGEDRVAVIIEPAPSSELAPLIVRVYGLTEREREVARYTLQGQATKQIALALGLSPYTVTDHLKMIFEKVGVNSRTELAARIFFDQYYPQMANREPITQDGSFRPLQGL
jgi:DNA-binding CsgD family transcriptional regulator